MIKVENSVDVNMSGTCLQGYITATRIELEEVFGPNTFDGSADGKTTIEWSLCFTDNGKEIVATIYDWKTDGIANDQRYDWHIGGFNRESVDYVTQYFNQHK